ncbi:ATP dependent DNA ligase domain-containing protein [Sarocladium implicatum]|nr:ATP dependent DNA ligase domain-containing protein [Sarocladium implicatum]
MPGQGVDLADCVERILDATPNPQQNAHCPVTVEHIDMILHSMASRIRWSAPKIREAKTSMTYETRAELEALYLRFTPVEAKWFTRLVLKTYEPLMFHADTLYGLCDKALPAALKVLDDFVAAIDAVQHAKTRLLPTLSRNNHVKHNVLSMVKPQCGIKIGRQPWVKARSIKHCLDMGHGKMSVERKIDGEYCQIHVDLSKRQSPIQIFSKSGKDSTEDRSKLHSTILDSLRLSQSDFSITQRCILEGELVVYSDLERKIRPFHTIRNHVTRRGRFFNTEQDSPPKCHEHLMIMYFDILSIDDTSLLHARHSERRQHLERVIRIIPGRSEIVPSQVIDFDHRLAASHLRKAFASVIVQRGEGLVLKPDDPYFDFSSDKRRFSSSCIKLKKEYIGNVGEIGDLAIVGAGFDPARAKSYTVKALKWTHFYVGCLNNKEEVQRWNAKPGFTVVGVVEMNETQLKSFIMHGSTETVTISNNTHTNLRLAPGCDKRPAMKHAFTKPPVIDLRCFSFDKEGNTGFWTPRFPGVAKLHFDRDFNQVMTFDELQTMAQIATSIPELEDSQENLAWIARLEAADPRGVAVDALSQLTASSLATPSPRRRTQSISDIGSPRSPTASRSQPVSGRAPAMTQVEPIPLKFGRSTAPPLTPPTSPALQAPQVDVSLEQARCLFVSNQVSCSSSKKRRSCLRDTVPVSTKRPYKEDGHPRKPLGCTEGNSSQSSEKLALSVSTGQENPGPAKAYIDLTASSLSSQPSACDASSPFGEIEEANQAYDTTNMTIPDNEKPSRNANGGCNIWAAPKGPDPSKKTSVCGFNDKACPLASMNLVFASYLRNDDRVKSHIAEHDTAYTIFGSEAITASSQRKGTRFLLLVDSIGKVQETRVLLDDLEGSLDQAHPESRPWVDVFDWRLLEDIKSLEDDCTSKKGYGGFSDPWRRWRVGVI